MRVVLKRVPGSACCKSARVTLLILGLLNISSASRAQPSVDHEVYSKEISDKKAIRVWLPKGEAAVRGLVLMANAAGSDSRDWPIQTNNASYIELARRLRFGMIGTVGMSNDVANVEGPLVLEFLEQIASDTTRPELRHAPFICTGFSAGGQFAYEFNAWKPERTIAFNVDKGGFYRSYVVTPAALRTPGIIVAGADDTDVRRTNIRRLFTSNRPRGARWAYLEQYAYPHNPGGTQHLFAPFFGRVTAYRYPADADPRKGPVVLRDVPEAAGWLADNATWSSGFTHIASFVDYAGDRRQASWLPDQAIAHIYRPFSSHLPSPATLPMTERRAAAYPISITAPRSFTATAGAAFDFTVDPKSFAWQKLEFFAGATKLGEASGGARPSVRAQLAAGEHGLNVVAPGPNGDKATAKPFHLHVRGVEPPLDVPQVDPSFVWDEGESGEGGSAGQGGNTTPDAGAVEDRRGGASGRPMYEGSLGGAGGRASSSNDDGDKPVDDDGLAGTPGSARRYSGGCSFASRSIDLIPLLSPLILRGSRRCLRR